MKKNAIAKVLLCATLLLAGAISPVVAKAEETVVTDQMTSTENFVTVEYDVTNYRKETPYTYPKKAGYIFAGWYTDAACTEETVLASDITTGKAYAKFVDEAILGVKVQIQSETKSTADDTTFRIVTSVGSDMYEKVGFKMQFEGENPFYASIDTVYSQIEGWLKEDQQYCSASELFSEDSKYLAGCTVTGFPQEYFENPLTITARWKTLDGTTVEGSMRRISIYDIIQAFDYDNADVANRTKKEAKIGDTYYTTFAKALEDANELSENVTIQLLQDNLSIATAKIYEGNKTITIDGCGRTVKLSNVLQLHQSGGVVTIKDMKIAHSGSNFVIQMGDNKFDTTCDTTVALENVDIVSTSTNAYALIATQDLGTFGINMTDVTVDWNHTGNTQGQRALIRCGATNKTQTVNLGMTGCVIDVSDAALTQCMYITEGATANITSDDSTTITTAEGVSVYTKAANSTNMFLEALKFANASKEDVRVRITNNLNHANTGTSDNAAVINNVYGKTITIDGTNKTLTTSATNAARHSLRIHQSSGTVTIKDLTITHSGAAYLMQMGDGAYSKQYDATVNLENVTITSTGSQTYCLVATNNLGTFDINMKKVTVDWNGTTSGNTQTAFIRCGAADTSKTQTVNLNMTESQINVSDTKQAQCMYITEGATAKVTSDDSTTITTAAGINVYTKAAKTSDEFLKALDFVNASKENARVRITGSFTYTNDVTGAANDKAAIINNENGKTITIDGTNKTLTTSSKVSGRHCLRVHQSSGTVIIKDLTITHSGATMLMRLGTDNWTDGTTYNSIVNLENVDITSTGTYPYCLIGTQAPGTFKINMNDVTVNWTDAKNTEGQRAFIRFGGHADNKVQTVNLNVTGCSIDLTGAAKTQCWYVTKGATVAITSDDSTTITTAAGIAECTNRNALTINGESITKTP